MKEKLVEEQVGLTESVRIRPTSRQKENYGVKKQEKKKQKE